MKPIMISLSFVLRATAMEIRQPLLRNEPMMFRKVAGVFMVLLVCGCSKQTTESEPQIEIDQNQPLESINGIQIDNGVIRGSGYTDTLGTEYNFRSIPITITNQSTIPMHVQLAFSKEYDYPVGYGDEKFRVIPLPKEWAQNQTTDSKLARLWEDFENHMNNPVISETVEPGGKLLLGIGTLYPLPAETWWIVPDALFVQSDRGNLPECDWLVKGDSSSTPGMALSLKLRHNQSCKLIPCGLISFPDSEID